MKALPHRATTSTYEALLDQGDPDAPWIMPDDEWESIAINYTSGTTGRPKGVVYHHRGRLSLGHRQTSCPGAWCCTPST